MKEHVVHVACGTIATVGQYPDGEVDYLCPTCDVTFLDNEEQDVVS